MNKNELVNIYNKIGFKLLSELMNDKDNICISPFSISIIIVILLNGATGKTKESLLKLFELDGIDIDEINKLNNEIIQKLKMNFINGIWVHKDYEINEEFIKKLENIYNLNVRNIYNDIEKVKIVMNKWIEDNTQEKIKGFITKEMIKGILVIIINIIYFKKEWKKKFYKNKIWNGFFYPSNEKSIEVSKMLNFGDYMYYENDLFQCINIQFIDGLSMYLILPDRLLKNIEDIKMEIISNWNEWKSKFSLRKGHIILPKFKISYGENILPVILNMVDDDFIGPEFYNMGNGELIVDAIIHKAFIEIDEDGVEAAAVTFIGYSGYSGTDEKFYMNIDHPFMYFICDDKTGLVLFSGWVLNPKI